MSNSLVDRATASLRDLIARGGYHVGDRLPAERELAEGLGLSRPTMREGIRRLVEAGVLVSRRGSGTYVADVDLDAVFAVRLRLEPYAARLAATERSPEQARRLTALVKRLATEVDRRDAFTATDVEVHRELAIASGNPVLVDVLSRLTELSGLSRAVTSAERETRTRAVRDLRALAHAVRTRDGSAAAQAMERHLGTVRDVARTATRDRRLRRAS